MATLTLPVLCLVTDRRRCAGRPIEEVVAAAVRGGAGMVQLREKDLPDTELLRLARRLRTLTSGRALLFINDRPEVAAASKADGVQLGEDSVTVGAARRLVGRSMLIGRSVHGVEGGVSAETDGADLLLAGTVFPSKSHPGRSAVGVGLLERLHSRVSVPILAIGGISACNIGSVVKSGASGAAVISAVTESVDPERATRELVDAMRAAWTACHPETVAKSL